MTASKGRGTGRGKDPVSLGKIRVESHVILAFLDFAQTLEITHLLMI